MSDSSTATRFGSCRSHSRQGLAEPANGLDGLCATCRSLAAEQVRKAGRYNGNKPLSAEPVPATAVSNAKRVNGRRERKQAFAEALEAALKKMPWARAVLEAGGKVELADKTARDYARELKEEDPKRWAKAEAARS